MKNERKEACMAIARTHPLHRVYETVDEEGMGEPYIPLCAAKNGVFREIIEWANAEYDRRETGEYPEGVASFTCCICKRRVHGLKNSPAPYIIQKVGRKKYCCSYCHESVVNRYMMVQERCGDQIAEMMKEQIRQDSIQNRAKMPTD